MMPSPTPAPSPGSAFDGVTITDWIQAGSSIVAVAVTAVSVWIAYRSLQVARGAVQSSNQTTNDMLAAPAGVRWRMERGEGRHGWRAVNAGTAVAHVVAVNNVSDGHRDALGVHKGQIPGDIEPDNWFTFFVQRSLASPAVTKVEIVWTEDDGSELSRVYNVL